MNVSIPKKKSILVSVCFIIIAGSFLTGSDTADEEKRVLAVIHRFFDVIATHSVSVANEVLVAEGLSLSIREQEKGFLVKHRRFQEFIDSLEEWEGTHKETMTDPKVLIHDRLAVVWAAYEFFIDGEFSHCGVDAFTLIKTGTGWKIAAVIYTVEKTGCKK